MFCTNCGAQLPDGTKFCTSCGAALGGPGPADAAPAAGPDPDKTVQGFVPVQAPDPVPSPPPDPAPRSSHGTTALAVIMSLVAVAAVAALAIVLLDPFGTPAASEDDQGGQAQEQVNGTDGGTDDAADDATADDADAGAADTTTEDDAATDDGTSRGGDNNVVVVVNGDKDPAPAPDTVVVHDTGSYVLPDSATHTYSASELSHLSDWELYLARNEIYARHGREFRNDDLQRYFDSQSWYTPLYSPDDFDARSSSILNSVEQANAATILSVEQSRGSAYI